ncbi:MAG TPA: PilZ domain-containing protein [Paracoccaceae bacterium]|nr:PilZ domain-containing protein [Paracoccaceae bacterium]
MTVLNIRSCRRYAMRLPVSLESTGRKHVTGLLIEISQEGARISNLGKLACSIGQAVHVRTPAGRDLPGVIRWAHDGLAGIHLDPALSLAEMGAIRDELRSAPESRSDRQRFGT